MNKEEIIKHLKVASEEVNILGQRTMGHHQLFAAEIQAGNVEKAEEIRGLLHALLDQTLDATARSNQLVHQLYQADD